MIENYGHKWKDWQVIIEPTCETTGVEERRCTGCDDFEQREVAALSHDWGEWHEENGKEVRVCKRDSNHREERSITVVQSTDDTDNQEIVEEMPETPEPEDAPEVEEPETTPEPEAVLESEPEIIEEAVSQRKRSWTDDWTPANTAVATGGGVIILALGSLLFTSYISPWLWIMAKRRKKREEVKRSMYA